VAQARTDLEQGDMATAKHVAKINLLGIWIHGKFIRMDFMHKEVRHRHTLGLEPTKAYLKHAARLRITALLSRDNLAFITNQIGHTDYSIPVRVYGRWIESVSLSELERIRKGMQSMVQIAPNLSQENHLNYLTS
jgi:hypothetical protein